MKTYKLLKPLPFCPVGRIFKETNDGTQYYHYMTDEEVINEGFLLYKFSKKHVESSPDFFEEVKEDVTPMKILTLKRIIRISQRKVNFFNDRILKAKKELEELESMQCLSIALSLGYGSRKIKGYKCPMDMFGGRIKKGFLFERCYLGENTFHCSDSFHCEKVSRLDLNKGYYFLPAEIVETWEAVYED